MLFLLAALGRDDEEWEVEMGNRKQHGSIHYSDFLTCVPVGGMCSRARGWSLVRASAVFQAKSLTAAIQLTCYALKYTLTNH